MSIRKNILVVCLLLAVCLPTGLISPLKSQDNPPMNKKAAMGGNLDCPGRLPAKEVDLCSLVPPHGPASTQMHGQKEIELKGLDRKSRLGPEHDDVILLYRNRDQIAWHCSQRGMGFQILKIERILHKQDPDDVQANRDTPNGSPFCPDFNVKHIGDQPQQAQGPGTMLYSGPPVKNAIGQCYKYTFKFGAWDTRKNTFKGPVQTVDPHVIVTGPDLYPNSNPAAKIRPDVERDLPSKSCVFSETVKTRNLN